MDEMAEQQEIANEISEAISSPVRFGQDAVEDELLAELEELEQEELGEQLLEVGPTAAAELPSVPTGEYVATRIEKAKAEMKELAQWAS